MHTIYETDIIVETPRGHREKFNYDSQTKEFYLKKVLPHGMAFPYDFGFIPGTKAQNGDPLDALIISDLKTFTGCRIACYLLGAILAEQVQASGEAIRNDRYLFAPVATRNENTVVSTILVSELENFFITYNDAEGKLFRPIGFINEKEAGKLIKSISLIKSS